MKIDKMTYEEKSEILARAAGWYVVKSVDNGEAAWCLSDGRDEFGFVIPFRYYPKVNADDLFNQCLPNLYNPSNIALAWKVINWIMNYPMNDGNAYQFFAKFNFSINFGNMMKASPAEAQRIWLDKILELVIEHDLVDRGKGPAAQNVKTLHGRW